MLVSSMEWESKEIKFNQRTTRAEQKNITAARPLTTKQPDRPLPQQNLPQSPYVPPKTPGSQQMPGRGKSSWGHVGRQLKSSGSSLESVIKSFLE